ncbi:F-type H+-transporting ATPase subunit gamma [Myxococcaceae bacterium]|nr:F-type H+-transporting ATPase subunit gamma [Myxococcaceae bacterium]
MAGLRDIKRRIVSVKKTQQITRAMRMVAAAKLRRAQNAILSARPYAERMRATLTEVARGLQEPEHPLLVARERVRRVDYVVVTSDRGLAGAFNANVLKFAAREIELRERSGEAESIGLVLVGRKANEFFRRRRPKQILRAIAGLGTVTYDQAVRIAEGLAGRFVSGETDEVVLVYSEFVSTLNQRPRADVLLPFRAADSGDAAGLPFEIEPDPKTVLSTLVPKALQVEIFRALLENQAGEHAARMAAMEAATRNTEEMIASLTLKYNRARQAAITRELVEIISGAEAL